MRDIQITPTDRITIYESIKELPIKLSKRFNSYLVQDAGIGATIDDVDAHLGKLFHFLSAGKTEEALEETKNMRYNLFVMLSGIEWGALSLLCLVHSINGEPLTDYSEGNLTKIAERLGGVKNAELAAVIDEVKKNLTQSAVIISREFSPMI